jgi:CTP:phosphocholine cytidylyltransferase-like protein
MDKSIEVTPQMIEAGLSILEASGRLETTYLVDSDSLLVRRMFLAMFLHLRRDTEAP